MITDPDLVSSLRKIADAIEHNRPQATDAEVRLAVELQRRAAAIVRLAVRVDELSREVEELREDGYRQRGEGRLRDSELRAERDRAVQEAERLQRENEALCDQVERVAAERRANQGAIDRIRGALNAPRDQDALVLIDLAASKISSLRAELIAAESKIARLRYPAPGGRKGRTSR